MSTHYQTMRKPGPSRALTAGVGVVLAVVVVLVSLAATHVFDHHTTTPAASQSGGQVAPNGSGGAASSWTGDAVGVVGFASGCAVGGGEDPPAGAGAAQLLRGVDRRDHRVPRRCRPSRICNARLVFPRRGP